MIRYRHGRLILDIDTGDRPVIYHINMVILDIDMGYGLITREMTGSIWSSSVSIYGTFSTVNIAPMKSMDCFTDPRHPKHPQTQYK